MEFGKLLWDAIFGSNFEEQLWGTTVGSNFAALKAALTDNWFEKRYFWGIILENNFGSRFRNQFSGGSLATVRSSFEAEQH